MSIRGRGYSGGHPDHVLHTVPACKNSQGLIEKDPADEKTDSAR
jgi:hypothetical protein